METIHGAPSFVLRTPEVELAVTRTAGHLAELLAGQPGRMLQVLAQRKPKSLRVAAFLDKPSRRKVEVRADFVGFTIEDRFVVGYGLDYAQDYRQLPDLCVLE